MSLRTKLLAAVVGAPVAILLIALWMLIALEQRVDAAIGAAGRITTLARNAHWREFGRALLEELDAGQFSEAYVMRWEFQDRSYSSKDFWTARRYFDSTRSTVPDIWVDDYEIVTPDKTTDPLRDFIYKRIITSLTGQPAAAEYMAIYPRGDTRGREYAVVVRISNWRSSGKIYWIMIAGALLTAVIGWLLLTRLVTNPLARLAHTADAIAAGRSVQRIPVERNPDEFGRTIEALNRMASEIAEYQGQLEDRVLSALKRMRKAEQHLAIAQRLAATGTLAAGLAHEINNPLGGMKNAVNALSRGDLSEEQTELYLELVDDGLGRIEQMVKKFVSFTPRRIEPQRVDLLDVVNKGVALTAHKLERRGIKLIKRLPPGDVAIVFGDANELQQVTLNLLLNAADALRDRPDPRIVIELTQRGEDWVLKVADNGAGIPPEDQDRIFDMFFTTKGVGEGSGMGLAVVHTIVTNHGGRIELKSEPGRGTTFFVLLPSQLPLPEEASASSPRA